MVQDCTLITVNESHAAQVMAQGTAGLVMCNIIQDKEANIELYMCHYTSSAEPCQLKPDLSSHRTTGH